MAAQFSLGKHERLKSRKLIEQLFKQGRSFALHPFRVFYIIKPASAEPLQFGVGASSKYFKKAVDRNRIKRLVRESYRLQKTSLKEQLVESDQSLDLFFIFTGKELPEYRDISEKTTLILNKLSTLIKKKV